MGNKKKTRRIRVTGLRDEMIKHTGHPWPRSIRIPNKKKQANKDECRTYKEPND